MFARAPGKSLGSEPAAVKQPVAIYLEVADVDHYFGQLSKKKGVNVTDQLATQWWGVRSFKVMDPHGYAIWLCQTVGEPKPPEGTKVV